MRRFAQLSARPSLRKRSGYPRLVFPKVCIVVFLEVALWFFPKVLWFCCGVHHRPAHLDLLHSSSSNNFCSTVTHRVHHKTCSVTTHASCSGQEWQPRECVEGVIKNAFFASCSGSTNVAIELDSIFASAKHDLIVHGKTVVNSQPLCLNSNLEETLLYK